MHILPYAHFHFTECEVRGLQLLKKLIGNDDLNWSSACGLLARLDRPRNTDVEVVVLPGFGHMGTRKGPVSIKQRLIILTCQVIAALEQDSKFVARRSLQTKD